MVVGLNLARGKIFTVFIGSVDSLYLSVVKVPSFSKSHTFSTI